ncbi:hypothetical protein N0V95_000712 [Ascochyta clinopodiicola]|nr:hypothetical protein N0V95_000712 [Ascochyta clinopodiicola]
MAGRGEYQKQIVALMAAAKAENLNFEDVLPAKILEHFEVMTELKAARELIKELDDRGGQLQTANETLTKKLSHKQKEIDDLPEEFKALKVELHQAQRQITLHKTMSEDSRQRSERYQRQLKETAAKQQTDASAADKIERLQAEVQDQQTIIAKLVEENQAAEAMSAQLRESDLKALAQKDKQLAKKVEELTGKNELLAKLDKELDEAFSLMTCDTEMLVDDPQEEPTVVQQENLQHAGSSTRREAQFSAAIISEMKPLNRFYQAVFQVVNAFAMIFQATSIKDIPPVSYIGDQLDAAQIALGDYIDIKDMMRASIEELGGNDMDQIALLHELDVLAASATNSQIDLEVVHMGFWNFLNQLSDDPKMLSNLNGALCDADRVHIIDLNGCV